MPRLNELSFYVEPVELVDVWAAIREHELRRQAYAVHVLSETLRSAVESLPKIAVAFALTAQVMRQVGERALELDGVPLELQREVLAIVDEARRGWNAE